MGTWVLSQGLFGSYVFSQTKKKDLLPGSSKGCLHGWCLGCQKTPSLGSKQNPLEDAGIAPQIGIFPAWNLHFQGRKKQSRWYSCRNPVIIEAFIKFKQYLIYIYIYIYYICPLDFLPESNPFLLRPSFASFHVPLPLAPSRNHESFFKAAGARGVRRAWRMGFPLFVPSFCRFSRDFLEKNIGEHMKKLSTCIP